ncbi:hypothetical protein [Paraclostridium bifermentans]|uniref:hypothetical protein n=1 Tax=Paraclostridium bifermentans TaxID=1490 RepID=UPI0025B12717|nr:hypothetical protein [Paraclostridium bifermentans]
MDKKPFDINRLFFIAKTQLNYTRQEFFDSTFKEIAMLIEELNKVCDEQYPSNNIDEENYIEKEFSIDQIPFL